MSQKENKKVEQVIQYNESSSKSEEYPSNEQELLGCQGKSESERKIPDRHGLQGEKKTQVNPKKNISNKQEDLNWDNSET